MSLFCCNNENECTAGAVVVSIIIGIITAFLRYSAAITVTTVFLWVLFGIAIVYLPITLIVSAFADRQGIRSCLCSTLPVLLVGISGTILTSIILLGITFAATSIVGAIITGLLLTFFALTVALVACLTLCSARCSRGCLTEN